MGIFPPNHHMYHNANEKITYRDSSANLTIHKILYLHMENFMKGMGHYLIHFTKFSLHLQKDNIRCYIFKKCLLKF